MYVGFLLLAKCLRLESPLNSCFRSINIAQQTVGRIIPTQNTHIIMMIRNIM